MSQMLKSSAAMAAATAASRVSPSLRGRGPFFARSLLFQD